MERETQRQNWTVRENRKQNGNRQIHIIEWNSTEVKNFESNNNQNNTEKKKKKETINTLHITNTDLENEKKGTKIGLATYANYIRFLF